MTQINLEVALSARAAQQGAKQAETAFDRLSRSAKRGVRDTQSLETSFGRLFGSARRLAGVLGVAFGGVAVVQQIRQSIGAAVEYESALTRLVTLVGISEEQTASWGAELRRLSGALGLSASSLAEAMFTITSGGARGDEALQILEQSAKAAAIGLGEAKDIGRLAGAAMQAFGDQGLTASKAVDVMVATVREGNLEAAELVGSLGSAIAPAATLGASFEEVGAIVAAYTRLGVSAAEATTGLRAALNLAISPADQARVAMEAAGFSVDEFRAAIRDDGLVSALQQLLNATEGNIDTLGEFIPNVRALGAVLGTVGVQGESVEEILRNINAAAGITNDGFTRFGETAEAQFARARTAVEDLKIELGEGLLPTINTALERLTEGIRTYREFIGEVGGAKGLVGAAIATPEQIQAALDQRALQRSVGEIGDTSGAALGRFLTSVADDIARGRAQADALNRSFEEGGEALGDIVEKLAKQSTLLGESLDFDSLRRDSLAAIESIHVEIDALLSSGNLSLEQTVTLLEAERSLLEAIGDQIDLSEGGLEKIGRRWAFVRTSIEDSERAGRLMGTGIQSVAVPAIERVGHTIDAELVERVRAFFDESERGSRDFERVWITALASVGNAVGGLGQDLAGIGVGFLAGGVPGGIAAGIGAIVGAAGGGKDWEREIHAASDRWAAALDSFTDVLADPSRLDQINEQAGVAAEALLDTMFAFMRSEFDFLSLPRHVGIREGARAAFEEGGPEAVLQFLDQFPALLAEFGDEWEQLLNAWELNRERLEEIRLADVQAMREDIEIRTLRLQGLNAEADALARRIDREAEFAEAIALGDSALVGLLQSLYDLEDAAISAAQAAQAAELGLDFRQRSAVLAGDDRGAFEAGVESRKFGELARVQQLFDQGVIGLEVFLNWVELIENEAIAAVQGFDQAVTDAAEAARQQAIATEQDLDHRILVAEGKDEEAARLKASLENDKLIADLTERGLTHLIPKAERLYDLITDGLDDQFAFSPAGREPVAFGGQARQAVRTFAGSTVEVANISALDYLRQMLDGDRERNRLLRDNNRLVRKMAGGLVGGLVGGSSVSSSQSKDPDEQFFDDSVRGARNSGSPKMF